MTPGVKICGLTRPQDAAGAAALGAAYVGVVFAGGPRLVTVDHAADVLAAARPTARTVGVFGAQSAAEIARVATTLALDVVQLHGDPTPADVALVRERYDGAVWAVCRVRGTLEPAPLLELFQAADAVLLDPHAPDALGGTGRQLAWDAIASELAAVRRGRPLVIAGGLTPANVAAAAATLAPTVVDVSSGVEQRAGIKDHDLMRRFVAAVATPECIA